MTLKINNLVGFGKVPPSGGGTEDPNPKSIVWACGIECGQQAHWNVASGISVSTSTVRSGARSLRCAPNGTNPNINLQGLTLSGNTIVGRFYIRFATRPTANTLLFYWRNAAAVNMGVGFNSADNTIRARRDTTNGSSGVAVAINTWYRVDFRIVIDGVNDVIDVKVDGVDCAQLSTASASAAGTGSQIRLGVPGTLASCEFFYDDVILSETAADYPLGPGHIHHFVPVADGTHNVTAANQYEIGTTGTDITNATTDSYQYIDEVPFNTGTPAASPDFLTNKTAAAAAYVEHIFGPASGIPTPTVGPRGVEVLVGYHNGNPVSGDSTSQYKLVDDGTENTIVNKTVSIGSGVSVNVSRKHYALAPTGGAWNVTPGPGNFNNVRHRFGFVTDAVPDQYLDGLMIEAEFSDVP